MLRQMRSVWEENNRARHERIMKELAVAQARQAEVTAYWNQHSSPIRTDCRTVRWISGRGHDLSVDHAPRSDRDR